MDCVLELPLLSLDLASPAQLSPRAPDLATTGLTSSSRAQAGQGRRPTPPPLILSSLSLSNLSHVFFREPANGGRRLSVSICPPTDPRAEHLDPPRRHGWAPWSSPLPSPDLGIWPPASAPNPANNLASDPIQTDATASFHHVRQACPQVRPIMRLSSSLFFCLSQHHCFFLLAAREEAMLLVQPRPTCYVSQPSRLVPAFSAPSSRALSRPSPHLAPGLKRLALWRSRVLRRARPPVVVFARAAKAGGPERAEANRTMAG